MANRNSRAVLGVCLQPEFPVICPELRHVFWAPVCIFAVEQCFRTRGQAGCSATVFQLAKRSRHNHENDSAHKQAEPSTHDGFHLRGTDQHVPDYLRAMKTRELAQSQDGCWRKIPISLIDTEKGEWKAQICAIAC